MNAHAAIRRSVTLALLLVTLACTANEPSARLPGQIGVVTDKQLREISGLALSRRDPERLWVLNDSGNGARLYAIDRQGQRLAVVSVLGARNHDWEDLASVELGDRKLLVIGDVGDNDARRSYVSLYLVDEPALADDQRAAGVKIAGAIHFRYPDGPRDAEGITVDPQAREVLVLSKRTVPPILYAVPLDSETPGPAAAITARKVGAVTSISPPTIAELAADPRYGPYASQPTALDYVPGLGLLVMTYARPYLFEATSSADLGQWLQAKPRRIVSARLRQAEAAALDGDHLLITSERVPAPLLRVPLTLRPR